MRGQPGQALDERHRESKRAAFEEPGAKEGSAHVPCTLRHLTGGKTPKLPLQPQPWMHPYLTPYKEHAQPSSSTGSEGARVLALLLFSPPSAAAGPSEALPEFLVWSLVHFYQLGKTKNHGW